MSNDNYNLEIVFMMSFMNPILQVYNLQKRFGTLEVLRDVSFEANRGEVIGLAGMSGSGKSVVSNIIAGLYEASSGGMIYNGKRLTYPFHAQDYGIKVIHQHPMLVEGLSITNNIFLGNEIMFPLLGRFLHIPNQPLMDYEAAKVLAELGVQYKSLDQMVMNLSGEQRQLIAIARAMVRPTDLIFIDEPTVLLSYSYQQKLLSLIQLWQQQGKTIIFSSTNLDHVFRVTDRIIVLRDGRTVASFRTDGTSREDVVAAMVAQTNPEHLTPVIWALDSYYRTREQADRLYQQAHMLEKDLVARDTLNQQLLAQLSKQVKALDQANIALQDAHRRLLTEREQERKHLARELHDQVIQDLLSTNYELEAIESHQDVPITYLGQLAEIRSSIRQLVEDIRRICGNLRPPTIDSLGLSAAIQSYTQEWSRRTGIEVDVVMDINLGRLPETIELSIFRIIQESLHNIHRHADATLVEIELKHTSPRTLMITIADNGSGLSDEFDLSKLAAMGHYGLIGISERVALLSGHLRLQNRNEGGLLMQVEVPHPRVDTQLDLQPF